MNDSIDTRERPGAPVWTISAIKAANRKAGFHFFDPATMRFFSSRIMPRVFQGPGGVFLITSERFEDPENNFYGPRLFTVREFNPETGWVQTARGEEFNKLLHSQVISRALALAGGYG